MTVSDEKSAAANRWIGRRITRVEDDRLLRGQGRYVDDIELAGMLHAAVLRSPVAHGLNPFQKIGGYGSRSRECGQRNDGGQRRGGFVC